MIYSSGFTTEFQIHDIINVQHLKDGLHSHLLSGTSKLYWTAKKQSDRSLQPIPLLATNRKIKHPYCHAQNHTRHRESNGLGAQGDEQQGALSQQPARDSCCTVKSCLSDHVLRTLQPSAIDSGELCQPGHQAQLLQEQMLLVLQVCNSLLAALRPACQCSLAVTRGAILSWSSEQHVGHECPESRAAPQSENGSFVRPTGPQEKQSSSQKSYWHEIWDLIVRVDHLLQRFISNKPVSSPRSKPSSDKAGQLIFLWITSNQEEQKQKQLLLWDMWCQPWLGTNPDHYLTNTRGTTVAGHCFIFIRSLSSACTER